MSSLTSSLFVLISFIAVSGPIGAAVDQGTKLPPVQFPADQPSVRIPIIVLANAPYAQITINGRGPFGFGVDTGSMNSPFAREQAEAMGFDPRPSIRTGQVTTVGLGPGVSVSIRASFASFAGLSALPGRTLCGDVGYNVLKQFVVEIDYEHGAITLFDPAKFRYSGSGGSFPFRLAMGYDPQIEGTFTLDDGTSILTKFTLDTGAGGTVVSVPLVRSHDLLRRVKRQVPLPGSKPLVDGVNGLTYEAITGRIASMTLGGYTLRQPLVAMSRDTDTIFATDSLGVNLGGNVLRRFNVFIDYPGRRLILEPNAHFGDPFPADASGLVLTAQGTDFKTIVVHGIVGGSPADESGIREGDVITTIDGESTDTYALYQIQDLFKESGRTRRVTIRRGDRTSTVTVKLRALA